MKLYMMRHGETAWNADNRILGSTDIPLNAKGREQAREAAERLKDISFDIIYTSELSRAKETGLAVAALQPAGIYRWHPLLGPADVQFEPDAFSDTAAVFRIAG